MDEKQIQLFDSHCHLTDEKFAGEVPAVIERAGANGVVRMVTISSDPDDTEVALELARAHDNVWTTAGIHPHAVARFGKDAISRIADLAEDDRIVAIGETGLDYYYDNSPRSAQRQALRRHVELAADLALPLIIHSREADADTIDVIREVEGEVFGVLHCFDGEVDLLEAGIEAGWMISFSGLITFKNYEKEGLVRAVPPDQLLIETDSPYLAPVPNRGKRNEPAFVRAVADALAHMRGEPLAEIAALTFRNASRFYGLPSA
ncbi:MAG TPA: TatD family hydrolase [Vicinamibacterales bacterium]|nr:TatD family hydrolase [Vicinamibacterales bacterium]